MNSLPIEPPAPRLDYCFLAACRLLWHPFPSCMNNYSNLFFGTQGWSWRLESASYKKQKGCTQEPHTVLPSFSERHIPLSTNVEIGCRTQKNAETYMCVCVYLKLPKIMMKGCQYATMIVLHSFPKLPRTSMNTQSLGITALPKLPPGAHGSLHCPLQSSSASSFNKATLDQVMDVQHLCDVTLTNYRCKELIFKYIHILR